jgi:predicted PurR-regulated permease PerM
MNILEIASFLVIILIMFAAIFFVVKFKYQNQKLVSLLAQEAIDKLAVMKELQDFKNKKDDRDIEQTEGFVKFLSQSRDWAFQYIELVQSEIKSFEKTATAIIYRDNKASSEMEELARAYERLLKLLPENQEGEENV